MHNARRPTRPITAGLDVLGWIWAIPTLGVMQSSLAGRDMAWASTGVAVVAAAIVQSIAGYGTHLYRGGFRLGSFEEVATITRVTGVATAVAFVTLAVSDTRFPAAVAIGAGAFVLLSAFGERYFLRSHAQRAVGHPDAPGRVVVFGAGEGGAQVMRAILQDPTAGYLPVALLDDDRNKRQLRLMGVPVMGTREQLADVVAKTGADTLLIAIPSADARLVRDLTRRASPLGLDVQILPKVKDLLRGTVQAADIRRVHPADLLDRREIRIDASKVIGYVAGKRVLVTGAGGSIGSELCRQLAGCAPGELIMLDRDESGLHGVQLSLEGRALLDDDHLVVADIRDRNRLIAVFEQLRPDVVFHAAALKHLPLLERHPGEAVKTNVWGTLNVLEVAVRVGVANFVNISTDKAVEPVSVLGYSKRITERLTAAAARQTGRRYVSVRFGNVLGSRGSVLHAFYSQLQAGRAVTVTHPEVTRYFMTVEEAVTLVIQAGSIGAPGEALVLDMGEPVRIADLARRLIESCGLDVDIEFTGLRPGEKLHEDLRAQHELDSRPYHPFISHVDVPPLDPQVVDNLNGDHGVHAVRGELAQLCEAPPAIDLMSDERPNPRSVCLALDAPGGWGSHVDACSVSVSRPSRGEVTAQPGCSSPHTPPFAVPFHWPTCWPSGATSTGCVPGPTPAAGRPVGRAGSERRR